MTTTQRRIARTREILRLNSLGISQRQIALSCNCSRHTVQEVLVRSHVAGINWPLPDDWDDRKLIEVIYPTENSCLSQRQTHKTSPDYPYIHQELARKGVNLKLLWTEYAEACRQSGKDYLQYAQFCVRYRHYAQKTKATMHIHHKPGERCEVDWAGTTSEIWDRETGEAIKVYLFVGVLASSKYTFARAYPDTKLTSWLSAHVDMLEYFQGVPGIIVPDNCRTAVISTRKDEDEDPVLNKSYLELAEHYGFAIIPARPYRPKDKPAAEKSVHVATTWLMAALRKRLFFYLGDLNDAITENLAALNDRPFQKLAGSRRSAFLGEEAAALQPLPQTSFELAIWKTATVGLNYHIEVDKSFYSVSYHYIKYKVDVRITARVLEIFYQGQRIGSHPRHFGRPGHYETNPDHLPANHQAYLEWNADRFRHWADKVGQSTRIVIDKTLSSRQYEQQAYRACMSLLKLADKHTAVRLEKACEKAVSMQAPRYRIVKNILESGQETLPVKPQVHVTAGKRDHRNVRGNEYYARLAQEMKQRQIPISQNQKVGGNNHVE